MVYREFSGESNSERTCQSCDHYTDLSKVSANYESPCIHVVVNNNIKSYFNDTCFCP